MLLPLLTCTHPLLSCIQGLEVYQWYKERGSVRLQAYGDINKEDVVSSGRNHWVGYGGQPWHKIVVREHKMMPLVTDAVEFVQRMKFRQE